MPTIRAAIDRLPGATVVDIYGNDEMWPFAGPEDIQALVRVGRNGGVKLCGLSIAAINAAHPFRLASVDAWVPVVRTEQDVGEIQHVAGCPDSVEIAPGSAFLELVQLPLASVADVIVHFDQLRAAIVSWPDQARRVPTRDGRGWIEYRKVPAGSAASGA